MAPPVAMSVSSTYMFGSPPPPLGSIIDITLSSSSFPSGAAAGFVVATINAPMTSGGFTGFFTLGGADAGNFSISGNNLVLATGGLTAGPYSITLTATETGVPNSPFGPVSKSISVSPITITNILNGSTSFSFPSGSPSGTAIAAMSVQVSPSGGVFTGTLSIGGPDAGSFSLTSTTLPCNLQTVGVLSGGPYQITITATQTGATGSPFTSGTLTITATSAGAFTTRTLNNFSASNLNTIANPFIIFGHPWVKTQVPTGNIVTAATLGGATPRIQAIDSVLESDNSLAWSLMVADLTGVSLGPASSGNLVMTTQAGTWSGTSSRTDAEIQALADTVQITNLSTTGTPATDMNGAGTWTADFSNLSAAGVIKDVLSDTPICRLVRARVPFKNGGTTHRFLVAWMYYFQMQLAGGGQGPIAKLGPFIENTQLFKTNPSEFDYDLAWLRGGVTQRTQTGVPHVAGTFAVFTRNDGLYDWTTGNDPQIWISQDYTVSRKTLKVPAFKTGISYVPSGNTLTSVSVSGVNTTTGIFSVSAVEALIGNPSYHADSVKFTATSAPSGITPGNTYWAATSMPFTLATWSGGVGTITTQNPHGIPNGQTFTVTIIPVNFGGWRVTATATSQGGSTFTIPLASNPGGNDTGFWFLPNGFRVYDNQKNANTFGPTGLIIPSSAGSGVAVVQAVAPMNVSVWDQTMGAGGGSSNDISLTTEWGAAYHVANTKAMQDHARVQAYVMAGIPDWVTDDATGLIPSFMDNTGTPAGMTQKQNSWWLPANTPGNRSSSDIGSNDWATGGINNWGQNTQHFPESKFQLWLMEGNPFLRDLIIYDGNRVYGNAAYGPARNAVISGVTYPCNQHFNDSGIALRDGAWGLRQATEALFASYKGGAGLFSPPYSTYFTNAIQSNLNFAKAINTLYGVNYQNLGWVGVLTGGWPIQSSTVSVGSMEGFMATYQSLAAAYCALLRGDFIADLQTIADQISQFIISLYNSYPCTYFGTMYSFSLATSNMGATQPPTFVSSINDVCMGAGSSLIFTSTNGSPDISWANGADPLWTPTVGDKVRFQNFFSLDTGGGGQLPPTPLNSGQIYFVVSVNAAGKTFRVSATSGGTAITMTQTQNAPGFGCGFIPSSYFPGGSNTCPGGFTTLVGAANADGYLAWQRAALCEHAIRETLSGGIHSAGAGTALTNLLARWNGDADFANTCSWAFQGSL